MGATIRSFPVGWILGALLLALTVAPAASASFSTPIIC
jgi:hypothetical protein